MRGTVIPRSWPGETSLDKVVFEQQSDEGLAHHAILGRGNSRYKGAEVKSASECSQNFQEASVAWVAWGRRGADGSQVHVGSKDYGGASRPCKPRTVWTSPWPVLNSIWLKFFTESFWLLTILKIGETQAETGRLLWRLMQRTKWIEKRVDSGIFLKENKILMD